MPGKKAGVLTIVGVLCVVFAVLIFSQYRQCAAAEGATLGADLPGQISALEADNRILQREIEALRADLTEITAGLSHCRGRTDDLRAVLKALIPVWPGRARLPTPNGEWDPWPVAGANREDYASLPRGK